MVFVNKLDRERADFERTLDAAPGRVRRRHRPARAAHRRRRRPSAASPTCSPTRPSSTTPTATPSRGRDPRRRWPTSSTRCTTTSSRASSWPTTTLMERYLEGDVPSVEELEHTLAQGVATAPASSRWCAARPSRASAVDRLADFICEIGPSPARPPAVDGRAPATPRPRSRPTPTASRWPSCSRRSPTPTSASSRCSRCCRARCKADDQLVEPPHAAPTSGSTACSTCAGKEQVPVTERAWPATSPRWPSWPTPRTGDTLAPEGHAGARCRRSSRRPPVLAIAVKARTQADDDKLASALHRLQDEDPALRARAQRRDPPDAAAGHGRDPPGRSPLERLQRKFGVDVDTEDVRVPYRETITGKAEAEGKYKKQSGGHGQFGVAWLRVEPLERGRRLRVRRQDRRRRHPPPVHPRGARRASRRRWRTAACYGFPVVDVRVDVLRRQVPLRRLLGDELQDGRLARVQGGHGQGRRRWCSSRSRCSRSPCPPPTRAT